MELLPADYVLLGVMSLPVVLGLFRGLSGTVAFFGATFTAAVASPFVWRFSARWSNEVWLRGLETFIVELVIFGIIRFLVRKFVHGLLSQPSDAFFGVLAGAAVGMLILFAWAYSGVALEYSRLAAEVAEYVR